MTNKIENLNEVETSNASNSEQRSESSHHDESAKCEFLAEIKLSDEMDENEQQQLVKERFNEAWHGQTKEGVFKASNWLATIKKDTKHGGWKTFVDTLNIDLSTADKLRAIGTCEHFKSRKVYDALPASWGTLATLASNANKTPSKFFTAIDEGEITPATTRKEATDLFKEASTANDNGNAGSPFVETDTGKVLAELAEREQFGLIYMDPPWIAGAGTKAGNKGAEAANAVLSILSNGPKKI